MCQENISYTICSLKLQFRLRERGGGGGGAHTCGVAGDSAGSCVVLQLGYNFEAKSFENHMCSHHFDYAQRFDLTGPTFLCVHTQRYSVGKYGYFRTYTIPYSLD